MRENKKRFLKENLLGLSLTCIGILLLAFSLILHFDHQTDPFVLASGNGLDGPDIQSLERENQAYERIADAVLPTVVAIETTQVINVQQSPFGMDPFFRQFFGNMLPGLPGQQEKEKYLGSGDIISPDGYILTNNHVVAHGKTIQVTLHDGRMFTGRVVGADPRSDVAVVKIDAHDLPTIVLGNSANVHVGDMVMAFGNPYEQLFTMTKGIVSAMGRAYAVGNNSYPEDFIQTDAAINPGNSGGALVNVRGQLIGIPTWILGGNSGPGGQGTSIGIGFAIPINTAQHIADDLIKTGKVTRGYLGANVSPLSGPLAKEFGVPDTNGALIQNVESGGPAAKAGLKNGDVIRTFNAEPVRGSNELTADVMDTDPGTTVTLGIIRNGKHMTLQVTLGTRPANLSLNAGVGQVSSGPLAGVSVANLTSNFRQQLGIPSDVSGVVVTQVDPSSPAANALGQGDVIMSIDHHSVSNVTDFNRMASETAHDQRTLLRVIHQGEPMYVVISTGDNGQ